MGGRGHDTLKGLILAPDKQKVFKEERKQRDTDYEKRKEMARKVEEVTPCTLRLMHSGGFCHKKAEAIASELVKIAEVLRKEMKETMRNQTINLGQEMRIGPRRRKR